MSRYEELINQLNKMPRGYISKKKIKGHEYHYLQWVDNGKIQSSYVRENNLLDLYGKLNERKQLEKELAKLADAGRDAPVLSVRARSLTGSLMMADIEVARFNNGELTWIDEERAPLYIARTHNISGFLASRAVDSSRTNARVLKKIMDIHGEADDMVALYSHGATITDNYWFRARGSKLRYQDIAFESDLYSDVALNGSMYIYNKKSKLSPELTLTGSYEKCWKLIGDEWWMYKRGNSDEIFSELLCSRVAAIIGIPTAEYDYVPREPGVVRTKNFADQYNFEPMMSIAGEDDSYDNVFNKLCELKTDAGCDGNFQLAKDYLKLIFFDTIVNNVDRHNENLGLMRDRNTGTVVGLAPNFDNNLALIARTRTLNMNPAKDGMVKYYTDFIKKNELAAELVRVLELGELTRENLEECINGLTDIAQDIDCEQIVKFVLDRYNYLMR